MKIKIDAEFAPDELHSFLQAIRDWEQEHQHVSIGIWIEASSLTLEEGQEILRELEPGFTEFVTIQVDGAYGP